MSSEKLKFNHLGLDIEYTGLNLYSIKQLKISSGRNVLNNNK
jgi:hypothetical protein